MQQCGKKTIPYREWSQRLWASYGRNVLADTGPGPSVLSMAGLVIQFYGIGELEPEILSNAKKEVGHNLWDFHAYGAGHSI